MERIGPNMLFSEEQRMTEPKIIIPVVIGALLTPIVLYYALTKIKSTDVAAVIAVVLGIELIVYGLMFGTKMVTEVRPSDITVSAWPLSFLRRSIPLDQIRTCEARTYSPLGEYGGWGIRYGRAGKAYNMRGNRGVQLVLASGERLLIGSQKADELAAVISSRRGGN